MSVLPILLTMICTLRAVMGPRQASYNMDAIHAAKANAEVVNKANARVAKGQAGTSVYTGGVGPTANALMSDQECQAKAVEGYMLQSKRAEECMANKSRRKEEARKIVEKFTAKIASSPPVQDCVIRISDAVRDCETGEVMRELNEKPYYVYNQYSNVHVFSVGGEPILMIVVENQRYKVTHEKKDEPNYLGTESKQAVLNKLGHVISVKGDFSEPNEEPECVQCKDVCEGKYVEGSSKKCGGGCDQFVKLFAVNSNTFSKDADKDAKKTGKAAEAG